jgi:hypothetical protein
LSFDSFFKSLSEAGDAQKSEQSLNVNPMNHRVRSSLKKRFLVYLPVLVCSALFMSPLLMIVDPEMPVFLISLLACNAELHVSLVHHCLYVILFVADLFLQLFATTVFYYTSFFHLFFIERIQEEIRSCEDKIKSKE